VFAETGTGTGTAVSHAMGFPFRYIYSCDIDEKQIEHLATTRYAHDPRISLYPMNSEDYLEELLGGSAPRISEDDLAVWFLDSHFPGFDLHGAAIDAEKNLDVRLPLHNELRILYHYAREHDVIICDDLRIYEHGPFAGKNMDEIGYGHAAAYDKPLPLADWETTHTIKRDYRDTGYLILEPKTL
jgi:hypothetical protein